MSLLKTWHESGVIRLKYLDESGCVLQTPVSYSWSRRGQQKCLEQQRDKGRRISILGLLQAGQQFDYGLAVGGIRSSTYLKLMDWQADLAEHHKQLTGQFTVVVQDNASIHRSLLARQQWDNWAERGLLIFFLPPYSPQLNDIEIAWKQFKTHELAGRQFADELDLVDAIIAGLEDRSHQHEVAVERFLFN